MIGKAIFTWCGEKSHSTSTSNRIPNSGPTPNRIPPKTASNKMLAKNAPVIQKENRANKMELPTPLKEAKTNPTPNKVLAPSRETLKKSFFDLKFF